MCEYVPGCVCVHRRETAEAAKQEIAKWREKVSECEMGKDERVGKDEGQIRGQR